MATGEDLRRLALSQPGTVEAPHFDRRAFKVVRTFATLSADGRTANIKFSPDEQELQCLMAPAAFRRLPNAWGARGWTEAILAEIDLDELAGALRMAWRHGAAKAGKR